MKYMLEIKNRLIVLVITYISLLATCYFYKEALLFMTTQLLTENFCIYYIFTSITEVFAAYIQIIGFFAVQATLLHVWYHFYAFSGPALFDSERYYLVFLLKITLITWVLSEWLSIRVLIPVSWSFFLSFQRTALINLYFEAKLNEYISLCVSAGYLCLFYSQVFSIFLFFVSQSNTNTVRIKRHRKLSYLFCIFCATFLSSSDVTNQTLLSVIAICISELLLCLVALKNAINRQLLRQPIKTN